jgi:hypothetical protein
MNAKLSSMGLALLAVATVSLTPAEARNNNQQALLNQIAMNNYLAQTAANNSAAQINNPLQATLASYNQPYGDNYGQGCDRDGDRDHGWGHGFRGYTSNAYGNNGYNNGYGNGLFGFGNNGSLAQKISNIQARLAGGNLSRREVNKLENKLAQLQGAIGINGYGLPYSNLYNNGYNNVNYNNNGALNGVRRLLGI